MKITHYGKTLAGLVSAKDLAKLEDCEGSGKATPKRSRSRG